MQFSATGRFRLRMLSECIPDGKRIIRTSSEDPQALESLIKTMLLLSGRGLIHCKHYGGNRQTVVSSSSLAGSDSCAPLRVTAMAEA